MKILIYFEAKNQIKKSGIGHAMQHQIKALDLVGVEYTLNPNESFDILHINTVGPNSQRVINKARKKGAPIIYHAHSTEEDFKDSFLFSNLVAPFFKKRLIKLYSQADLILTPTLYSKGLLENYGLENEIIAISNGIDIEQLKYNEENIQKFKETYELNNCFVAISVGLYFERKGILDFIDIARKNPQIKFIWFGHTNNLLIPKKIRKAMRNKPKNLIFPGYITGDIIKGAFLGADVFMFPTHEETEGIVVLEALAAKQQVLIYDIGVYDGWLENKKNCYKAKDKEELSNILVQLQENSIPRTATAGYEIAKQLDINNIAKKLVKIYAQVLQEDRD
ncbi:MAG: glycosyltransferase [Spiroplasma sp.]|nr:glycosyltransferase [Mycoplasmatales bacterium]